MILDHLKEKPKNKLLIIITLIAFVIFISLTLTFSLITSGMSIFEQYGVLNFEFAWTAEQINIIFAAWGNQGMLIQTMAVYLDFLYIVGYSFFIFGVLLIVARKLEGKIQNITIIITSIAMDHQEYLGTDEDYELMAVVTLGYPEEGITKGCRKNLKSFLM